MTKLDCMKQAALRLGISEEDHDRRMMKVKLAGFLPDDAGKIIPDDQVENEIQYHLCLAKEAFSKKDSMGIEAMKKELANSPQARRMKQN